MGVVGYNELGKDEEEEELLATYIPLGNVDIPQFGDAFEGVVIFFSLG